MGSNQIFIFGGSGFVGRNLLRSLKGCGYNLTCPVRDATAARTVHELGCRPVIADLLKPETYRAFLTSGSIAVYLVRTGSPRHYARDHETALTVAEAAAKAGVSRLIHLTGLLDPSERLAPYFASRYRVAQALEAVGPPTTLLRASMIFGEGSISYELLRAAVERLPIIPLPPWRNIRVQPVAIADVIHCLVSTIERSELAGRTLDIGGPKVYTYGELLKRFAASLGLRRRFFTVPFEARALASLLLSKLSGVGVGETAALLENLKNTSVVPGENTIVTVFGFQPTPVFSAH